MCAVAKKVAAAAVNCGPATWALDSLAGGAGDTASEATGRPIDGLTIAGPNCKGKVPSDPAAESITCAWPAEGFCASSDGPFPRRGAIPPRQ